MDAYEKRLVPAHEIQIIAVRHASELGTCLAATITPRSVLTFGEMNSVKVLHQHQLAARLVELGVKDLSIIRRNSQASFPDVKRFVQSCDRADLIGREAEKLHGRTSSLGYEINPGRDNG